MLEAIVHDHGETVRLTFEHSLLSLSKWEARNKIPFLTRGPKSSEELIDYYRDMLTSPEHDPDLVYRLSPTDLDRLSQYLSDPMTASTLPDNPDMKKPSSEVTTSDTIYMQMVLLEIPFAAETWHMNRLMMLIAKTADAKQPPKKENRATLLNKFQEMSQRNREKYNSKG